MFMLGEEGAEFWYFFHHFLLMYSNQQVPAEVWGAKQWDMLALWA